MLSTKVVSQIKEYADRGHRLDELSRTFLTDV